MKAKLTRTTTATSSHDGLDSEGREVQVFLHSPAVSQLSRALTPDVSSLLASLALASTAVVRDLCARRSYVAVDRTAGAVAVSFDPRFLVFEYLLGFVLRPRQVELVNSLVQWCAFLWGACMLSPS